MVTDQDRIHRLCGICGVTGAVTGNDLKGLVSCNFYVLLCNNIVVPLGAGLIPRLDTLPGVKVQHRAYALHRHKPGRRVFHEHPEMILHTLCWYTQRKLLTMTLIWKSLLYNKVVCCVKCWSITLTFIHCISVSMSTFARYHDNGFCFSIINCFWISYIFSLFNHCLCWRYVFSIFLD